jgi:uncharacterized protein (DUF2141 family)
MRHAFRFIYASLLVLVLAWAGQVAGQTSTTGSIEGRVTDPNGAAVRGASVTVTSPNMISAKTAMTDDQGHYQILALPPGSYKVAIEASGFGKFDQDNIGSISDEPRAWMRNCNWERRRRALLSPAG